ncbi:MAG: hypothetical protein EXR71_15130 [Myxococcales bacterium]|nr:hypothetical protein [Myxococcales bacterium]
MCVCFSPDAAAARLLPQAPQPKDHQLVGTPHDPHRTEAIEGGDTVATAGHVDQSSYAGILAGNAAWRSEVVPKVPSSSEAEREARASLRLAKRGAARGRDKVAGDAPAGWAELLKRVFGVGSGRRAPAPRGGGDEGVYASA